MSILSVQWWQENMPKGWSGTGISKCLRTYAENDHIVTQSGESTGAGSKLTPATQKAAELVRDSINDALGALTKWEDKGGLTEPERFFMHKFRTELEKAQRMYAYV